MAKMFGFRCSVAILVLSYCLAQECTSDGKCDTHERCSVWAEEGNCLVNKEYMRKHCPASCAVVQEPVLVATECKDYHERCSVWADLGECYENKRNMERYCAMSCGLCREATHAKEAEDPNCKDSDERCAFWASKGECSANPRYMHSSCARSCGTCKTNKRTPMTSETQSSQADMEWVEKATLFGEVQKVQGAEAKQTLDVIRGSVKYMEKEGADLPSRILKKCLNRNELCAFWAALGECQANQAFMLTNCAPSCKSCHLIDMESRCPPLPDAVPALVPGGLNKMFERIVKEAPGNKTLSEEERRALQESGMPEYTVNIVSRPSTSPAIEISEVLDKSLPPWIVTFDNFLTHEECDTLIKLGYDQGYERSRDVGGQNFDGSFDGVESSGRTSENAWCSDRSGCRNEPAVQKIMNRMSQTMGIPAENSEDFQVLKYEKGQFYNSHHDYIPHQKDRQCGPRILTFFLYLSDVEAGGGTRFTSLGHTVQPKKGRALLWPSILDSDPSKQDGRTMHEAMPVVAGTKFAANGWIHLFDYLGPQERGCN